MVLETFTEKKEIISEVKRARKGSNLFVLHLA